MLIFFAKLIFCQDQFNMYTFTFIKCGTKANVIYIALVTQKQRDYKGLEDNILVLFVKQTLACF